MSETIEKKKPVARAKAKKVTKTDEVETTATAEETVLAGKVGAFISALGRRKTSIARVRLIKNGTGAFTVNGKPVDEYFTTYELRSIVKNALKVSGQETAVDVSALVEGGGIRGQAESVRLGISRALIILNPTFRKTLKKMGFLMRDPRAKERKKPGLKKARRAPQWSKR